MKTQLLLVFLILGIIIGCNQVNNTESSLLNYLPERTGVVVKINNLSQLKSELKNNTFIETLAGSNAYKEIAGKVKFLNYIQADSSAILSFVPHSADTTEFILVFPRHSDLFITENPSKSNRESLDYKNITMVRNTIEDAIFFSTVREDHFLISSSKDLLAEAINDMKSREINPVLASLFQISNPDKSASVFVRTAQSKTIENTILKKKSGFNLADYAEWISLDLNSSQDNLNLYGVSLAQDSTKNLINLFSKTIPVVSATPSLAPSIADAILAYSLNDYDSFAMNQKEYLNTSFVMDTLFNAVEEIGHIYIKDKKAIVLHTYDAEDISQFLEANKKNTSTYQGNEIITLNTTEFLNTYFNPIIKDFTANYFTVLENAFVFSTDLETIQQIIAHYKRAATFSTNAIYKAIGPFLADESCILYISNAQGVEKIISKDFTQDFRADFNKAKTTNFAFASQMVTDDNFYHTNLVVKEIGKISSVNETSPIFSIQLDGEVQADPQFVINHRTGKKEIVVQDLNNNLYLIATNGKVLWKKKLNGKIQGKIVQVDIYKNGRLQLAFTTSDQFIILDRNGKEVNPFNKKFPGGNLNPLAVFDYENNKNYRFVITQGTKVFMYNSKGQIVKGFKYTESESPVISAPRHFRIGKKDYLVFTLENGKLKILNREGKIRIPVNETIDFSENKVLLYKDKFTLTDKSGTLFVVDQKGNVSKSKLNLNEDHGTDATSKTLVTMNDNILTIKGKKVSLDLGVYTKPRIFYIYDKIYVSVTDVQSEQVYLFDSNAKSIPNFPIMGASSPDLADIDNDKKLELVTKEKDSSLVVLKMN